MTDALQRSWARALALALAASGLALAWFATLDVNRIGELPGALLQLGLPLWIAPHLACAVCLVAGGRRAAGRLALLAGGYPLLLVVTLLALPGEPGQTARGFAVFLLVLARALVGPPLAALVLTQLGLVVCGWRVLHPRGRGVARALAAAFAGVAVLAAGATARNVSAWLGSDARRTALETGARVEARDSLRELQRCLRAHAAHSPGGYPRALAELGTEPGPCAVLRHADAFAGYELRYAPAAPDAKGQSAAYGLELVPADPGRRSWDGFRSDETGAVQVGLEPLGGEATALDDALLGIQDVVTCLEHFRFASSTRSYPAALAALGDGGSGCFGSRAPLGAKRAAILAGEDEGHRYSYAAAASDAGARIDGYRLDVRPVAYGRPFTRSYRCSPEGRLRYTDEDRPAGDADLDLETDAQTGAARPYYCLGRVAFDELMSAAGRR